jgi:GNAT superfamily N-acetyltransferase
MLEQLIRLSVQELQPEYTPEQRERALEVVFGVDTQLIDDGTYFVAEASAEGKPAIAACGGWSKRKTLFGGDRFAGREDSLLDPAKDAAKIRAFFVHPEWARQGIGSRLLELCEEAARSAGFRRLEMGATLAGVPLYRARGYIAGEQREVPLGPGFFLPIVHMVKQLV